MIPRALGPLSLAAGLALAACDSPGPAATGAAVTTSTPPAAQPPAASAPPETTASALASAAPAPSPAAASASAPGSAVAAVPAAQPARSAVPIATAVASARAPKVAAVAPAAPDAGPGDAGAVSPALQIVQQVDGLFNASKRYSAHFKQQYTAKVTGTVKESSGVVSIERPGKISFRYDPPSRNRIVSDGTTMKVYIADDNQMFESPVQKSQYPGALSFMMGNGISTSFTFTLVPSRYAGVALEGKPLVPNPSYQTVTFLVDTRALNNADLGAMAGVVIVDAQSNKNRFDFQGASQPPSFPADEFSFTPPPGTNITR